MLTKKNQSLEDQLKHLIEDSKLDSFHSTSTRENKDQLDQALSENTKVKSALLHMRSQMKVTSEKNEKELNRLGEERDKLKEDIEEITGKYRGILQTQVKR